MSTSLNPAIRPRKAPLQARARATHDAVVEAAAQIIAAGGLAAFTTNAVAVRAGVSIGSLYQYFPNKDALMVALIQRQQRQQLDRVAHALVDARFETLEGAVRTLVRAAMQHHRDDSLLASAIDHEEARLPVADMLGDFLDQGGGLISALFARFADEVVGIDPAVAARTLPALVKAAVDCWANRNPPQLDTAEREAVRAVLGYIRSGQSA